MAGRSDFETKWEMLVEDTWDDAALKERLLNDPHTVLRERGIRIPEGLEVKVVADSDTLEHLVLPPCPTSEDEISEQELESVAGGACQGARTCRTCRSCRTCRGCQSCRTCRACKSCRP